MAENNNGNGEDKLIAVARHIAKTLGRTETMTDDILQIFQTFDGRFSKEKMSGEINSNEGVGGSYVVLENDLKGIEEQILGFVNKDGLVWSDSGESAMFLEVVDELLGLIRDWDPLAGEKMVGKCLDRADEVVQLAMFRLEDEFRMLIQHSSELFDLCRSYDCNKSDGGSYISDSEIEDDAEDSIPVAQPVTDFDIMIDALPSGTISDLHEIAKRMVAAGFKKECAHVYSSMRREFLEESISRLGLRKFSSEEVQKLAWSDLEDEIEKWTKATKLALLVLFPSERRICDRIFFGLSSAADLAFMEVCRGSTIQLLNFADAVAIGSRSPERLFKILDVFETLRDLMPKFDSVFADQYCGLLRTEAGAIFKRLGETIRGIFMELENLIRRDPAKAAVPGGGCHPITRYVMNYLRAACGSRQTLEQVFQESIGGVTNGDFEAIDNTSSLSVQISWIMELLESNLEAKSKMYRDSALSSVFLMNNGRYIVQKVKDSELGSLLGDDWIRKHLAKVKQCHASYQRSSWVKVQAFLKVDSNILNSNLAAKTVKDKLKVFNMHFDEICRTQSTWVVADEQLRDELRTSVVGNLVPAYRNFLGRFQSVVDVGRNSEKYVKYNVEDIEARIHELFQGSSGSSGGRK